MAVGGNVRQDNGLREANRAGGGGGGGWVDERVSGLFRNAHIELKQTEGYALLRQ